LTNADNLFTLADVKVPFTVRLDPQLIDRIKRDAKRRRMTLQGWVDWALYNELKLRKKEDEILQESRKSE
jgi:hypothetical protein